jgi:hypothetical protein
VFEKMRKSTFDRLLVRSTTNYYYKIVLKIKIKDVGCVTPLTLISLKTTGTNKSVGTFQIGIFLINKSNNLLVLVPFFSCVWSIYFSNNFDDFFFCLFLYKKFTA